MLERYAALQLALAMEIERSVQSIDCEPYVALADKVGPKLVSLVGAGQVLPRDLFRLARHDFNTFTHVTNVAGYAVILAEQMGIADTEALNQVAVGAMLHDIGKRFIPASILTKPTRLQPAERTLIELHPTRGYEELCRRPGLNYEQLMMVYQHHERIDGTGYPVGSCGDEIHPWARMLAVVDVFDAITGIRPYRRPATARNALDYIRTNSGTYFDSEVSAMLVRRDDTSLIRAEWESADAQVQLPEAASQQFFGRTGPMPNHHENARRYHRYFHACQGSAQARGNDRSDATRKTFHARVSGYYRQSNCCRWTAYCFDCPTVLSCR